MRSNLAALAERYLSIERDSLRQSELRRWVMIQDEIPWRRGDMHVIGTLSSDMYDVEFSKNVATIWDVFPGWNAQDRFGIVIY